MSGTVLEMAPQALTMAPQALAAAAQALAAAAQALAGCRFRLHGRDPPTGLDCIGVLTAALAAIGRHPPIPNGYALRSRDAARFHALAAACGFLPVKGAAEPGDVTLFHVGPCQFHLAVHASDCRIVHAHAGLRRVVIGTAAAGWSEAGHWRLRSDS
jgi:hypothetical protein